MRSILAWVVVLLPALAGSAGIAHAEAPTCKTLASERNLTAEDFKSFVAACERVRTERESAAKSPRSSGAGVPPAEEERLDRAMTRNLLQSIEEELRRKQPGK
jgi:hypothetical protein